MRGSDVLPENVNSLFVDSPVNTPLTRSLQLSLRQRGVSVTANSGDADASLKLLRDDSGQRILSVAVTEGPEEYEVYHIATVTYVVNGQTVINTQTFTLTRDYTYDKNDILGKRKEYDSLRAALADEMAETIIRRIRFSR